MAQALELQPFSQAAPERMKYWGGFFDETLFFDIQPRLDKHTHSFDPTLEDNLIYYTEISIANSGRPILESLSILLPGKIYPITTIMRGIEYTGWELRLRRQVDTFRFITGIKPYLDYTHQQADVMERFLRQKREVRRELEGLTRVPRYPTPEDRIAVEEEFRTELVQAKSQTFNEPHLPELARLAGIIDASAGLGIYASARSDHPTISNYMAHMSLTSVHRGLLDSLYQTYGGSEPSKSGERGGRYAKPSYEWQIGGFGLIPLLESIEPHLIFKRDRVQLVLDFLRLKPTLDRSNRTNNLNPVVVAQRTRILQSYVDSWQELTASLV